MSVFVWRTELREEHWYQRDEWENLLTEGIMGDYIKHIWTFRFRLHKCCDNSGNTTRVRHQTWKEMHTLEVESCWFKKNQDFAVEVVNIF